MVVILPKKGYVKTIFLVLILIVLLSTVLADSITSSQADGLVAYAEKNIQGPRYRLWNESNILNAELTDANVTNGNIVWVVTRGNHERDEIIVGTQNDQNEVYIQVYDSDDRWGNLQQVSIEIKNSAQRGFDIVYESISGDALIVYENDSGDGNNDVAYRIWNGTGYSEEMLLDTDLVNAPALWVALFPKRDTDDIMTLIHNEKKDLYVIPWNGIDFVFTKKLVPSTGTTSNEKQHFAFAWESSSGDGLLLYGVGTDIKYRVYDPDDSLQDYWGAETTLASLGDVLNAVRTCSDPNSDYIGVIWQDSDKDVQARMWNGTHFLASPPSEDTETEGNGKNNANIDCAWHNSGDIALFGFIDKKQKKIAYFNFTKTTDAWGTSDLTLTDSTSDFATDMIKSLRFTEHPLTDEIMIVALDESEDISMLRWNGTEFVTIAASPIETDAEVEDGGQEGAMFDWYRYDPAPHVEIIDPDKGLTFSPLALINITANVTDNIAVATVLANVTLPNGTAQQLELTGSGDIYTVGFAIPAAIGRFNITFIANDTSNNINSTVTTYFFANDTLPPNVSTVVPTNVNEDIAVSYNATVADNIVVSSCSLYIDNINNGSMNISNGVANGIVIFSMPGTYTLVVNCSDSSGNYNDTSPTTVTVNDTTVPIWSNAFNETPLDFNASSQLHFNITWSDNFNLSGVWFEVNRSGTLTPYLVSNVSATVWNLILSDFPAGTHHWRSFANDTSANENTTDWFAFTISKIAPTLNLTINGTAANLTVNESHGLTLDLNGTLLTGDGGTSLTLSVNGSTVSNEIAILNLTNLSYLSERGTYNVTLGYPATENYSAATLTYYFIVQDQTVPVISDATSSSISQTSATVTWTTDDLADSSATSGGTSFSSTSLVTSHSVALTSLIAGTAYTWTLQSCNADNFCAETPLSITTSLLAGGSAVTIVLPNKFYGGEGVHYFVPVTGRAVQFVITKKDIPLSELAFDVSEDLSNVNVVVSAHDEFPTDAVEEVLYEKGLSLGITTEVHNYFSIEIEEVGEDSIRNAKITFEVEKSWLKEINGQLDDIVLMRFHDGIWKDLLTRLVNEGASHYFYEADTPGFSVFAIALKPELPEPGLPDGVNASVTVLESVEAPQQPPGESEELERDDSLGTGYRIFGYTIFDLPEESVGKYALVVALVMVAVLVLLAVFAARTGGLAWDTLRQVKGAQTERFKKRLNQIEHTIPVLRSMLRVGRKRKPRDSEKLK